MIRAVLLALIGAASFAAVYAAMAPKEAQRIVPDDELTLAAEAAAVDSTLLAFELRPGPADDHELSTESAQRTIRDVTPTNMTAAPHVTGPLALIEPPESRSAAAAAEARMERLFNPIVISAGLIEAGRREIRLAGIEAPAFDQSCGEGAAAWPCGRMARAALRRFIRGRAIECEVPAGAQTIPDSASCQVGGADMSAWLVAQGWATPASDFAGSYAEIEATARAQRRGLWSDIRPDA